MKRSIMSAIFALLVSVGLPAVADSPVPEAPQGYHLDRIDYWNAPYFANSFSIDHRNWRDKATGETLRQTSGQLSATGYPLYLDPGQTLQTLGIAMTGGHHMAQENHPNRNGFYTGQVVLTWEGDADIRVTTHQASFVAGKSDAETGVITNGRRVYILPPNTPPYIEIQSLGSIPLTEVKCWLPDPTDPQNKSLENQLFHPDLLDRLSDRNWSWIRVMNWLRVNQGVQQDWIDRRLPDHAFQNGILNERSPAEGVVWYTDGSGDPVYFPGDRITGCAFEIMVELCNVTTNDLWITVPHLATDDFITQLAQLIAFGSDGINPYTAPTNNPVWAPLNSNLTVYVEYSNEIWSNGGAFPQGNWAQAQADALSIERAQFNARKFSNTWNLFEDQLGTNRITRICSAWTADENYTSLYIEEFFTNSLLLKPELLAVSTYYGNGIQNWANDQGFLPTDGIGDVYANTNDIPAYWDHDLHGDPQADPWTSTYWSSEQLEIDLTETFAKWRQLLLSGQSYGGNTGFDNVDLPGGFGMYLRDLSLSNNIPLIAYEGGPSLYTDQIDIWPNTDDEAITSFVIEANRREEFAELYYLHINQAFERGLVANIGFTDVGSWGKFGQWGHLEYLGQPVEESPKYAMLLQTYDEFSAIRRIDDPLNAVPSFLTPIIMPTAETGIPYSQTIELGGGDGALTSKVIASVIPDGLAFDSNTLTITGVPTEAGTAFIYLRILDADLDPAWSTFTFPVVKRSSDPAATIDFEAQTAYPGNEPIPVQPLVIGEYTFASNQADGLAIKDEITGWPSGWPSTVLHGTSWGSTLFIERTDGEPFDLFSFEIGSIESDQCLITLSHVGGGTSEILAPFPRSDYQVTPLILKEFELDLVSLLRVDFKFLREDGYIVSGAIDNLKLNQIAEGSYEAWAQTIDWDGADNTNTNDADNDTISNMMEYAMDLDPVVSNGSPVHISIATQNAQINYRRSRMATSIGWKIYVTSNLLDNSWTTNWPDASHEVIDPDVDGDQSAEQMQFRVPTPEDQNLFFRIDAELP